jgi:hypothetical protein
MGPLAVIVDHMRFGLLLSADSRVAVSRLMEFVDCAHW